MKTLILPGYSTKNKEWGEEAAKEVNGELIEWQHWSDPTVKFNAQKEADRLLEKIGDKEVNIIAKSLGTSVLARLLSKNIKLVNKVILCGVPINDMDENDLSFYKILSDIDAKNIIAFQNSNDEHGEFEEVRRFLTNFNPNIKVTETPGSTHDYPYFEEFKEFLK